MPLSPIVYLPHGGGPLPLLGDPAHHALIGFLSSLGKQLAKPRAVLVISAHWEAEVPEISADSTPGLLFDYGGFPPEAYQISYPVNGSPRLAENIYNILLNNNISSSLITGRGLDHGAFVPLKLIFPEADVPCVQLSLITGLDAKSHILLGRALISLREQGVLILGSGMSFHNLRAIFAGPNPGLVEQSDAFDAWLRMVMTDTRLSGSQRLAALDGWMQAPAARFCHPRAEHLLPLMVCAGAAAGASASLLFNQVLLGHKVSGFGW